MKSKATISRRHCPGEDYGISKSICSGRQKAHYPKCRKCDFRTDFFKTSPTLPEEQNTEISTTVKQTKTGLKGKTRNKTLTGTKPVKSGPNVKATKKTSKAKKLTKTGSIMVKSEPSSATIYLNGDGIGVTPAIIRQIVPGTYEIKVKMDGYNTWKQMVDVVASKEKALNAVLQGENGTIIVGSDPSNANVFIDNEYIGITPAEICQVVPGTYEVKVKIDRYDTWRKRVDVVANKKKSLTAILKGKNGAIVIESEPTNAKMYIDDDHKGDTPVTLTDLSPGEYTVEIKLNEHETWKNNVNVEPGKEISITAVLLKKYGSIILESEPSNAILSLDGKKIGTTPANLSTVSHGTHLMEVIKDGYEIWKRKVNVEPGREKSLTATLQLKTGSVSIESKPTKAMIYLDGKYAGTTPDSLRSIIPGTHEVKVNLDGYDVWSELVNVEAGKEKVLTASLQRKSGSIMIESEPAKATIYFDGNKIGVTPDIIISGSVGTHLVDVRKEGYNTWTKSVDIEPGKETTLSAILQAKTSSIIIDSQPSPALIIINGNEAGVTPGTITDLIPGTYKIEAKISGYEVWSKNVEVVADKEISLTAVLQRNTGSMGIISKPSGAKIYLDGEEVGVTPYTLSSVDTGPHEIELMLEGYAVWKKDINIKKGKGGSLNASLQINTGSVNVKSDPGEAIIFLNGNEHGKTPESISGLITGIYNVEVKLDGYEPWKKTVKIKPGKEISLISILNRITGAFSINSKPSAAMVFIDGKNIGVTPKTLTEIIPGNHLLELRKDGYEAWNKSVGIIPGKEVAFTAELQVKPGTVSIKSEPSNAKVFLNDKEIGTTPVTKDDLLPGTYMVEVKTDGYEGWNKNVEIMPGKEVAFTAELQAKTGSVNIKSEPSDATVLLDEKDIGNTPIIINDLVSGKHNVVIRVEGFEDWSENIVIIPEKEVALTAELQMQPGSVSVKSEPPEAMVFLDEKNIGATPISITDLQPGTRKVEIKMDGYEDWSKSINIINGKDTSLTAELQTLPGSVSVQSEPSDAIVILDNKEEGKTPIIITGLRPGTHNVVVKIEGHEIWSENIVVKPNEENSYTALLSKFTGSIYIKSKPPKANIYLDGEEVGTTPDTLKAIDIGPHEIEVKTEGHTPWRESININKGKNKKINVALKVNTGSVNIKSEPPDARATIDGNEVGNTPVTITELKHGMHSVEIKREGYKNWNERLDIIPDKEIELMAILQMKVGSINIKSNPSNAIALLDGKEVGTTPKSISELLPGPHKVEVRKDGYVDWCENVDIILDNEIPIEAVLQIKAGTVYVKSEPANAKVLVENKEVGATPVSMTDLMPGTYNVEVIMEGYENWKESVDVISDKEISLTAELQMQPGSVSIKSEPPEAMVFLDEKNIGATPVSITDLQPGTCKVEVKMDGYEDWSKSVNIINGKEASLTAELQILPGSVSVQSKPSDAIVILDNKEEGETPITITGLRPGTHSVVVKIEGHENWSENIVVKPNEENSFTALLSKFTGSIYIKSKPPKAKIYLDGEEVGITPGILNAIDIGPHEIEVKTEGHTSWKESININKGKNQKINVTLQISTGSANIKSEPSDAKAIIDGNEVGNTPVTITDLKHGMHSVEIKMEGYKIWKENVDVISAKEISLTAELQILPGSVSVQSEPSDAIVILDNKEEGETPVTITGVRPGTHSVVVKIEGYENWSKNIVVKPNEEIPFTAVLKKLTGSIYIKSKPPKAKIYFNGEEVGITPGILNAIDIGPHEIEVKAEGHTPWKESININKGKNQKINVTLQITTGSVNIKSEPSDARAIIDGNEVGNTPVTITDLKHGMHSVEVNKEGYGRWSESVDILPDKETVITAKLQMETGTVYVKSEPTNAKVLIDDKEVGTTPVTLSDLIPGTFNVEVIMEGYENWSESVEVISDKEIPLIAKLQMQPGFINITSEPVDAIVILDDKETGTTPITKVELKPGKHKLEVKMDGYERWNQEIDIKQDEERTITAVLRKITGSIDIKSNPPKAMILLGGEETGTTPETITSIAVGPHEVEISLEGYKSWKKSINIKKGENKDINAVLQVINGSVSIMSEPTNAKTILDGKEVGNTPVTITDLKPGTYNVEIILDGYNNWKECVNVIPGNEISLSASLKMKPGSVSIQSEPTDATVLLDDKDAGTTPITIADLTPGIHNLVVRMKGHESWNEKVNIKPDGGNSFTAVLQKITGTISVKSSPTKAIIHLDGEEVGTTPETISSIVVGSHEIEISIEGHKSWKESLNVEKGKNKNINVVLQIIPGSVSIKSEPPNAMALINDKEFGTTPIVISDLKPGMQNVEVKMNGYEDWKENINIISGKEISLVPELQIKVGSIRIESEPADALVLIDDKEVGNTPIAITDLKPAMHNVEIRKIGYINWVENIEIICEKEIFITAALQVKAGSFTIKSEPIAAKTIIDGKEAGTTPVTITDLKPGTHNVKLMMSGYDDWNESIDIIPDKEIILTAALQINTGSLSINSKPSEAMVIIDDKEAGSTPITIIDLKSGPHIVAVRIDGYDEWRESADITPGKETTLTAKLHKKAGTVSIQSDPPGAKIFLEGNEVGTTPKIIADLIPGVYNVEITKSGYVNWNINSVNITPGKKTTLAAELKLKTGAVSIKSEPSGAKVLIDGKEYGTTPVTIIDFKPGMHNVEVSVTGYEIWNEKVDIKPDKENSFKAILHKFTGSIFIKSKPPKAKIYLDGEEVGITPVNLSSVAIGKYEIEVRTEGFTSWKSLINIDKGKNKRIKAVLQLNVGSLNIKSNPSNAKVLIDGNEAGVTPVTKTDLKAGIYNVEVMKEGYVYWKEKAEILPCKEIALKPVLQLKSGSINMISEPSDATILMNGKISGTTPISITDLKPGTHQIEARMDGYYDWRESIEIVPGKEIELTATLQFRIGSLNINSNPSDAKVFIGSREFGVTPNTITDLKPGTHNVEIMKDGYETWKESVDIIPDKEIHLIAVLQLIVGSINLKSNPANAKALIDGREVGTTPISISDLKPGTHYLEVRIDGYDDWRENLDIIPGKEMPLMASLQMKAGAISIISNPSNAKTLVDGKEAGTTPITKTGLKPGTHNVEVLKNGYDSWKEDVNIMPGKEIELTAILQMKAGAISIKSNPSDAIVLIDGNKIGNTPISSDLIPGKHNVDIRMNGYNDWKESVDIMPDKKIELTAILQMKVGSINIMSNQSDAMVLMDGKEVGPAPKSISDLLPGPHKVDVRKDGYVDWCENVNIISDKEITLSAILQIKAGSVSVKSEPTDAEAFINGKVAGTTPITINDLKPGTYMMEVRKEGHENWKEKIVVNADKENSIVASLLKITGSIAIKSTPLKAKIYVDGKEAGTTPATISSIPVGSHEIEIKVGGYENWKRSIIVKKGKEKSLNAMLQLNIGSISIESYPEKAKIILDGKEVGKAPKRLTDIIVGTHEVEVIMDGYVTWKKTIKLKAAKEISLTADLKKGNDTIEIKAESTVESPETQKSSIHETREIKIKPEKSKENITAQPKKVKSSPINKKNKYLPDELIMLRSTYNKISNSQINSLPKLSIRETNNSIFFCHSTISHCYQVKPIADGDVVIDHATELMWYQTGSKEYFNLKKAIKWLKMANKNNYAGFNDWRLPTLEEASSLLELEMNYGNYIDPVFDKRQWGTWTGDKCGRSNAWIVTYVNGTVSQSPVGSAATFVRPVRSLK